MLGIFLSFQASEFGAYYEKQGVFLHEFTKKPAASVQLFELEERYTCEGILVLSASMLTTIIMVAVTSTVERHPTRLSQDNLLKLGMKIIGTIHSTLTDTAK